ncbi:protease complex subunit PrcB family protein [Candidatus Pelagibacter sp.]|nr:protease complex subunit PrcB family protein [Candidatus Pelagibacter sp.]
MNLNKLVVFLTLFLFSCSNCSLKAQNIYPTEIYCNDTSAKYLKKDSFIISYSDKNFKDVIKKIPKKENSDYNLLIYSKSKPSAGYKLKLDKILIYKNKMQIYLNDIEPPKGSMNAAIQTYPFCLLKIENLNKFKVYINNKRKKN